jgi:hypothetical protein
LCRSGNSNKRRSGKARSGEIFCGPGSTPRYSFRGEGSDKDFSLQSQTRGGKLNRNTPEIQEMGNFRKRSAKKLRRRKWSSYRRRWRITWFGGESFSFRGLSFPENHLRISFRCS